MKTSISPYCINVTALERSVQFYQPVLGLGITYRIETPEFTEIVLKGDGGNQI